MSLPTLSLTLISAPVSSQLSAQLCFNKTNFPPAFVAKSKPDTLARLLGASYDLARRRCYCDTTLAEGTKKHSRDGLAGVNDCGSPDSLVSRGKRARRALWLGALFKIVNNPHGLLQVATGGTPRGVAETDKSRLEPTRCIRDTS